MARKYLAKVVTVDVMSSIVEFILIAEPATKHMMFLFDDQIPNLGIIVGSQIMVSGYRGFWEIISDFVFPSVWNPASTILESSVVQAKEKTIFRSMRPQKKTRGRIDHKRQKWLPKGNLPLRELISD